MSRGVGTAMKISSVEYSFIDALKSVKRNRSLSGASVATVAATLFIFGIFMLISVNMNLAIKGVESQLEIRVVLKDDISINQQNVIQSNLRNAKGVESVTLETKSDALKRFKDTLGKNNQGIVDGFDSNNPLPNTYVVKVNKPSDISSVVKGVKNAAGIDSIEEGKDVVDKVMAITNTIRVVGIIIFLILFAVSFFLIGNTIKLTVFSRRKEIGIMKYIGATDWFIRIPFIIEGILLGIFGAIISDVVLYYIYKIVSSKAVSTFTYMELRSPHYVITTLLWEFVFVGIIIGSAASIFSVRKFLSV